MQRLIIKLMVHEINFISNSSEKGNIKTEKEFDIDFSECLNTANNKPVMDGVNNIKLKGPFMCGICGKTFKYKSHLLLHSIAHSNERPYVCDICMCSFKMKRPYLNHCKRHVSEKSHKCSLCEKTFLTKWELISHQAVHSDSRPFICKICNRGFKSKYSLNFHAVKHSCEKKFVCEICNKAFKRNHAKLIHIRTHTCERPYPCDLCEKSFGTSWILKSHKISHLNKEKEHYCTKCNANISASYITKHSAKCKGLAETDPEKRPVHKCAACNKIYKTLATLRQHTKSHSNPKSCNYIYAFNEHIDLT